jgi:hypothetical protein
MPLFGWIGTLQVGWNLGSVLREEIEAFERDVEGEHAGVHVSPDRLELARLEAERWESDREAGGKLARSRWLEANDGERMFPCGIVPDPILAETDPGRARPDETPPKPLLPSDPGWASPGPSVEAEPPAEPQPLTPLRPMQVIAVVLPNDLVFIREQGEDEDVDEVGRLPRSAIREVDVVDEHGSHVPEPISETIEPSQLVFLVLRWKNDGVDDEDRFAFRSPWMAWQAARHLRAATL